MTKYCQTLEAVIGRSAHEIQIQIHRYTRRPYMLPSIDDNEVLQLQIHLTGHTKVESCWPNKQMRMTETKQGSQGTKANVSVNVE